MDDAGRTGLIEEAVAPVVADHGLLLVDVEWRALRAAARLRLYVDKPGGVGIADCERLSREIGDVLDAAAVIEGGYDLEVSSPGLDRQLRKEREYRWAVGRQVRCWLAGGAGGPGRVPAGAAGRVGGGPGGAEVRGRLTAVTADRLVLDREGEQVELGRADVTKARLEAEVPWPRKA